ncbi:MAG: hypothetical protein K2K54_04230 [Lachnospiraceae bacterium]|nr:hypothetical protein [Lachnospiraceae bacterium]
MDSKQPDKIAAFDTLYTNNHIQMLKILFPNVQKELRHHLAVYIKYLELQYTIALREGSPFSLNFCSGEDSPPFDFCTLCDELSPFCSEKERSYLMQFKNMQNMIKQYKEIEAAMSMMKELFPEGMAGPDSEGSENSNPFGFSPDMLMQLLSPEQQTLFSMFQNKED